MCTVVMHGGLGATDHTLTREHYSTRSLSRISVLSFVFFTQPLDSNRLIRPLLRILCASDVKVCHVTACLTHCMILDSDQLQVSPRPKHHQNSPLR